MLSRRNFTMSGLACATTGCGLAPEFDPTQFGLSTSDSRLEADARKESGLRIDVATGLRGTEELFESFKQRFPGIAIDYRRATSQDLHTNFLQETGAGHATADILISSAMDLQFKLVNDGFAQSHNSPEKPFLPEWAVWNDQAYVINVDPLVFVYNRKLMPPEDVPESHYALADLLRRKAKQYQGMIATYDPELSGTGYLYYTQDLLLSRDTLDLVQALGRTRPSFFVSGADVRNGVATGKYLLGYNMVRSFMIVDPPLNENIGIVYPSDYTLISSRVAFIPKQARHPALAKLFLDFMLSEYGQKQMATEHMYPIRKGVALNNDPGPSPESSRPIRLGPALLANLDEFRRRRVLHEWRRTLES